MDPLMLQLGTRSPMSVQLALDTSKVQTLVFNPDEERWFAAREPKRAPRDFPSIPPPLPIGDAMADSWFR